MMFQKNFFFFWAKLILKNDIILISFWSSGWKKNEQICQKVKNKFRQNLRQKIFSRFSFSDTWHKKVEIQTLDFLFLDKK